MVQSSLNVEFLKKYMRVSSENDDELIGAILDAARQYAMTYTGLSAESLDMYADITIAILAICADMYDLRQVSVASTQVNPTVAQILNSHCMNLL